MSSRTYRQHFDFYYDKESGEWRKQDSSGEESGDLSASENDWDENASDGHLNGTPYELEKGSQKAVPFR